ncbi:MAG: hypothetical protein H6757_02630 [Candidatus Omnitrophica bacterium]|nr:hypothetical protein [Candidatus Omnitrophota bacterium]
MKKRSDLQLPSVIKSTTPALEVLTTALGIPREILASDDEIQTAWDNLPRVLQRIPRQLRSPAVAKMCVAVASGLFDSAINYVWNASVTELRDKVHRFGLNVVQQLLDKSDFDEKALLDLKDAELLSLALQLNLITEDGFFFLDQCRDVRNTFSAAHPTASMLDDHEFIVFVNRCAKYALGNEQNPVGVDTQAFITAVKGKKFTKTQQTEWLERLYNTHEAQRGLLLATLHGIYCDPSSEEETRINALCLVEASLDLFTAKIKSELILRHQDYNAKGIEDRHAASQQFFERLNLMMLLSEAERHTIISNACSRLRSVHQGFDNFYNEPPFAERLFQLSTQGAIPDSAKDEFVMTVTMCAVGNPYGVSNAAFPYYERIIKNFSPAEIAKMLKLPESNTVVGQRIRSQASCKDYFMTAVSFLDHNSVPTKVKKEYTEWLKGDTVTP